MIRRCCSEDCPLIYDIINEAAQVYRGVIPADRWHEPYMPMDELNHEIAAGVEFWGYEDGGRLVGVMGLQDKGEVALIRHAYVRTNQQGKGIGGALLAYLTEQLAKPILIGTWADASWAIRFYEKHGFVRVTPEEKNRLLKRYWTIPERQVETSVVLADANWFVEQQRSG